MASITPGNASPEVLTRSIDRFLRAEGWQVTAVAKRTTGDSGYDVTLTKTTGPNEGHQVTRYARSAGEATLKACSSARLVS